MPYLRHGYSANQRRAMEHEPNGPGHSIYSCTSSRDPVEICREIRRLAEFRLQMGNRPGSSDSGNLSVRDIFRAYEEERRWRLPPELPL